MKRSILWGLLRNSASATAMLLSFGLIAIAPAFGQSQPTAETESAGNPGAADATTIVYGQDFFAKYPNAVAVRDIIQRIPAGQQILASASGSGRRGFSAIDDKVLINGKRLSGKINDSESVLGRITVAQVERIEIIRGSSPDIKVASAEAIINIVLKEDEGGSTGSYRLDFQSVRLFKDFSAAAKLNYGGKAGKLGYNLTVEGYFVAGRFGQRETLTSGAGDVLSRLDEQVRKDFDGWEVRGNFDYAAGADTTVRFNGLYVAGDDLAVNSGRLFEPDEAGELVFVGDTRRRVRTDFPNYEVGGDIESRLNDDLTLKVLALANRRTDDLVQGEDFLITGDTVADDIRFISSSAQTERVGRTSLTWQHSAPHQLEAGTEFALNRLNANLRLFERSGGDLVEVPVDVADTEVKELRNESFLIHTWRIGDRFILGSQLITEWSRISQSGVGVARQRELFFLRPEFDFKWNLDPSRQIQLIARREISQLDFIDFASTASEDDQVVGGNTELEPERTWRFNLEFEKRLADDGGRIKIGVAHRRTANMIDLIEVSPGVSGRGNIGKAVSYSATLDGSFRMRNLGLPNLLIEPYFIIGKFRVTDPFTGKRRRFNQWTAYRFTLRARHDIPGAGLSYGLEYVREGRTRLNDIDEYIDFPPKHDLEAFLEKKLFGSVVLRLEGSSLLNVDEGRERFFFADGIAGGILTTRELRRRHEGRRFDVILRGTF